MATEPLVLGIESSCDETGAAVVRGHSLLSNALASSMESHARFGGVIPEVAARAHLESMTPVVTQALDEAEVQLSDLDAVAVTAGPGLAGALLVGLSAAKAYALAAGKPLYGVNHLVAHIAVDTLDNGPLREPAVALLVSGGHTALLRVDDLAQQVTLLGETLDDAAGEAYDKVGRLLDLPFPGGPHIDSAARAGDGDSIPFPRGLSAAKDLRKHPYDFSFSGLKTAVARWIEARREAGEPVPVDDVAASFQEAVCDVLTRKAVAAARDHEVGTVLLGGGVVANSRLRALAQKRCEAAGLQLRFPRRQLCTDNGAMVAALGSHLVAAGVNSSPMDIPAVSSLPVTTASLT